MEQSPEWYEIVVGIISIPAGIFGLVYSFFIIKKVNLESKKIELEILEKNKIISDEKEQISIDKKTTSVLKTNQLNSIILKFILLCLILLSWGVFTQIFTFITGGMYIFSDKIFGIEDKNEWYYLLPFYIIQQMPKIINYLIIIIVGVPLIKEINNYLNITLKDLLRIRK